MYKRITVSKIENGFTVDHSHYPVGGENDNRDFVYLTLDEVVDHIKKEYN